MCVVMEHCARILSSNCSDAMGEREEGRKRRKEKKREEKKEKQKKERKAVARTYVPFRVGNLVRYATVVHNMRRLWWRRGSLRHSHA